ncbi:MAG: sulfite exporter TauE/SafE family protein [Actinomycetota bacterium]|nr:sulfite exporter TauE/SafE family protein [Actinomycetota bacterium]
MNLTLPLELGVAGFLIAAFAVFVIGLAKSSIPAAATMPVGLFALVIPAKLSVGAILPLLILGDIMALLFFRKAGRWDIVVKILPSVFVGMVIGYFLLAWSTSKEVAYLIGGILIFTAIYEIRKRIRNEKLNEIQKNNIKQRTKIIAQLMGVLVGIMTMTANSAGPIFSLYLLQLQLPMQTFVGTNSWLFFIINVSKLPFNANLGIITSETLLLALILAPFVILGALLGQKIMTLINQRAFEYSALISTLIAGLLLFIPR